MEDRGLEKYISLSTILSKKTNRSTIAVFDVNGEIEYKPGLYVERFYDKEGREVVRMGLTIPTLNGAIPAVPDNIILSPIVQNDDILIPINRGGFKMSLPSTIQNKTNSNRFLIPLDETEVHEYIHSADHKRAFDITIRKWTMDLIDYLEKNFVLGISDPLEELNNFYETHGDPSSITLDYISECNSRALKFHNSDNGNEIKYSELGGPHLQERDPMPLYIYAKENYQDSEAVQRLTESAIERYEGLIEHRKLEKVSAESRKRKQLEEEKEIFDINNEARQSNQNIAKTFISSISSKSGMLRILKDIHIRKLTIFDQLDDLMLSALEKKQLIEVYENAKQTLNEFLRSGLEGEIVENILAKIEKDIKNIQVVDWSKDIRKIDKQPDNKKYKSELESYSSEEGANVSQVVPERTLVDTVEILGEEFNIFERGAFYVIEQAQTGAPESDTLSKLKMMLNNKITSDSSEALAAIGPFKDSEDKQQLIINKGGKDSVMILEIIKNAISEISRPSFRLKNT